MSIVYSFMVFSLLPAHPSETIRRHPEVNRSHAQPFFVLVALVDTMPVTLTGFSGVIRPLSIMFYAAKGDIAIEVTVL